MLTSRTKITVPGTVSTKKNLNSKEFGKRNGFAWSTFHKWP